MSDPKDKEWLFRLDHMLAAIREIQSYATHATSQAFSEDRKSVRSVERCFEILGEAARKIPKEIQDLYTQIPWKRITGLRNILAHDYDETNAKILWETIQRDLAPLEQILSHVIEEVKEDKKV